MLFTRVTLFAAMAIASLPTFAADRPNFSGEWKINLSKSDLGEMPAPDSWVRTIQHKEPGLTFATIQQRGEKELKSAFQITTDGKEATFQMAGNPAKGTASWDGNVLILKTTRDSGVGEIIQNERASLSPDGRTITFDVDIHIQERDVKMKLVFEKI